MGKKNPDVSVLLSVYNSANSLDRCLKSIQDQTYQAWTIVCINDASMDETTKVLKRWQQKLGSQLQVIHNETNLGLTKSLNKGLKHIATPFTARIDADDWFAPEKLERQVDFLRTHPEYGVIGCNYVNVGSGGEQRVQLPKTDQEIRNSIFRRNPFAHSCVVFKTDLIRKLGGYDETVRYGQDYDLWLRCYPKTKFYNVWEYLCFRTIGSGISIDKQRQQMWQSVKTQTKYIMKYRTSPVNYLYVTEPLLISLTPKTVLRLARKLRKS